MKIPVLVIFFAILNGAYGDRKLPDCESPPIEDCVLTDETVRATDGETVWKTTEILLHHQVAQNFLSSGKNFQIFWSEDLLSNGPKIVNKTYARHYQIRWDITEHIIFTHNDNEWAKVVINATVQDFKALDQIYLKVVLHLADGDTLISPEKHWFEHYKNDPSHTTTSPLPTPNITDRNATGMKEGTCSQTSNTTIIIGSIAGLLLPLYLLGFCTYKKQNTIQSQTSRLDKHMSLSHEDYPRQRQGGSRRRTELPMSAGVNQDT